MLRYHVGWAVGMTAWQKIDETHANLKTWVYVSNAPADEAWRVEPAARAAFQERLPDGVWEIAVSIMPITARQPLIVYEGGEDGS